jgi:hypothetical protein
MGRTTGYFRGFLLRICTKPQHVDERAREAAAQQSSTCCEFDKSGLGCSKRSTLVRKRPSQLHECNLAAEVECGDQHVIFPGDFEDAIT